MMKKLLFTVAFVFPFLANSQCNLNFESGTFSGWTKTKGFSSNALTMAGCCTSPGSSATYILTTPITTNFGGMVPHSPLGGTLVAQVGDSLINALATKITYSFVVTGNSFQYAIAPVDSRPTGHTCKDQSYNAVLVKDNVGNIIHKNHMIPDTTFGGSCVPGGTVFTTYANMYAYACWSTYSVNVGAYIGQSISVEVISANCTGGGHWAYCYFDAACSAVTPTIIPCGLGTGINDIASEEKINIWPNPVKDKLQIKTSGKETSVVIFDILGKEVFRKNDLKETDELKLEKLEPGVYFYRLLIGEKQYRTGKLIKE